MAFEDVVKNLHSVSDKTLSPDTMQPINPATLLQKGVHHGHLAKNWQPSFKPYLFMEKNGYHIINVELTIQCLKQATEALQKIAQEGKKILFVGCKKQTKNIVEATAKELQQPYVTKKWLGGMLTNFTTIKRSLKMLRKMAENRDEDPAYLHATKKEKSRQDRKKAKLEASFQGMKELTHLPAAIFVVDVNHEHTAVQEAHKLNIPIFAIVDSNAPAHLIHYPIPGNDDTASSVQILLEQIKPAILAGKKNVGRAKNSPHGKNAIQANIRTTNQDPKRSTSN